MKKYGLIAILIAHSMVSMGQAMHLKDLTDLLDLNPNKLDNVLNKKGFKTFSTGNQLASFSFQRNNKEGTLTQLVRFNSNHTCIYETNSPDEFHHLRTQIKNAGFNYHDDDTTNIQLRVYQKQIFTIETDTRKEDTVIYYILKFSKKELPRRKEMMFAEDLLLLDSHEYLCEMFGRENVRPNVFYYTETDSSRCSVLFPGTTSEAIVIWKDQVNLRKIEFILIGGSLRSNNKPVMAQGFNNWRSRSGVFCGMTLQELETLNEGPVKFYNWNTESPGCLVPKKNTGKINFQSLGLVLQCLNCNFIEVSTSGIIDSSIALQELQKVFVGTLIIIPD